jgi:L-glyceraldehyde 3-phosphate reductase
MGCIVFSPLAQGLLTDNYLHGVPEGSRASKPHGFLKPGDITKAKLDKIQRLGELAKKRGQTLAQMAVAWVLRNPVVTSAVIGASRVAQIDDAVAALKNVAFSANELAGIETILAS